MDRVSYTGIFGLGCIGIIYGPRTGDVVGILDQGTKFDRFIDLRFLLFGKVNGFCIAAALKVENTVGDPAMLIIPDKPAF